MVTDNRTQTFDEHCIANDDAKANLFKYAEQQTRSIPDSIIALEWVLHRVEQRYVHTDKYCYEYAEWDGSFRYQTSRAASEYKKNQAALKKSMPEKADAKIGLEEAAVTKFETQRGHEKSRQNLEHCMVRAQSTLPLEEAETHRALCEEMNWMMCELQSNPKRKANAIAVEALMRCLGWPKSSAQRRLNALRAYCSATRIGEDETSSQVEPKSTGTCTKEIEPNQQE